MTVATYRRRMARRVTEMEVPREEFVKRNSTSSVSFQTEYDGVNMFDIQDTDWHLSERKPVVQRRKKRIIF